MLSEKLAIIAKYIENWWNNSDQNKPLILAIQQKNTQIQETSLEQYWTDVDGILARFEQKLAYSTYHGVAVPYHHIDFSATAMACSLGGEIEYVNHDTVWSHPVFDTLEQILDVKLTPENLAYRTQIETTAQSAANAANRYYVSPWNLGGILDTISGLYGTENLLMDLATEPDRVLKVIEYLTRLWLDEWQNDIALIETSQNPGHVCGWVGIWAPGSSFPIQEDFAYMISPEMFRRFCIPSIRRMTDAMDYPLFHLDGIGMIPHLDALLEIENLRAIQWQPGAGKEALPQWYDLIKKIVNSGKSCQVFARADEIKPLVESVGPDRLLCIVREPSESDIRLLAQQNYIPQA